MKKHAKYLIKYVTGLDKIVNALVFRCIDFTYTRRKKIEMETL